MDRDVVEGNFTSLESSARFSGPREPLALMDFSHQQMNDLGLTPSPGFQLQGQTSQDEEPSFFDERGHVDISGGRDGLDQTNGGKASSDPLVIRSQSCEEPDIEPSAVQANNTFNTIEAAYDPLFDSTIPELDSVFSRKRTGEELQLPPDKRQHVESPDQTPSLTTDSTHESPASFFDTFDSLFGGSAIDLPLISPEDPLPEFEEFAPYPSLSEPVTSESTRQRFSLDEQDVLANTTREVLQIRKVPEYVSPYPISGGRLGYLPSTPGIHVRCVAMAEEKKDHQILSLRNKVYQLTRERDLYKKSLSQYAKLDSNGKTPEQLLREENAMLRRVSSRHQARVDQYKKEAAEWKEKLHVLGVIHNNLLYEIGVEKRIPSVVPVPEGYKPPPMTVSLQGQLAKQLALQCPPSSSAPASPVPVHFVPNGNTQSSDITIQQPSHCEQQQSAVTIDLTDDEPSARGPPPDKAQRSMAMLQSLRSKKYDWLRDGHTPARTKSQQNPGFDDDELALLMEEELSRA